MAIPKGDPQEERDIPETEDYQEDEPAEEELPPERPRFRPQRPSGGRPFGSRFGGSGGRRGGGGRGESAFERVTGLFENENGSLSGKVAEDKEIETDYGTIQLPAGTKFVVLENRYARTRKDPGYVLLVVTHPDDRYQRRGGRR